MVLVNIHSPWDVAMYMSQKMEASEFFRIAVNYSTNYTDLCKKRFQFSPLKASSLKFTYYFIWVYLVLCFLTCTVVVLTCFVMCGCFDNCVGVLVICVLVFTMFCIVCTVFLYCFVYVYLFLFVLSVLV